MADALKDLLAALQKQLDMVAGFLLGDLSLAYRPRLVVADAETASTDGQHVVTMPKQFCGVGLEDGRPEIFLGLLAHEIGHWLQPLKEIEAVQKRTKLLHDVVNIVLDVHCENHAVMVFPLFHHPIKALRERVRETQTGEYTRSYRKAQDFVSAAMAALLYSRYCVDTSCSFAPAAIRSRGGFWSSSQQFDNRRVMDLLAWIYDHIPQSHAGNLPALLEILAHDYPELCCEKPPVGMSMDPMPGIAFDGGISSDDLQIMVPQGACSCPLTSISSNGRVPPSMEVLKLSRQLKARWVAPASVQSVMAPGRLDRQAALRSSPMPFSMQSHRPTRTKETGLKKILLALDWSGSMGADDGAPWSAALAAARAIALAIQADGGDVRTLLFSQEAWHTKDFDPSTLLFARTLGGGISLDKANGPDTVFGWLPEVWQQFPDHQVLVLTDGAGHLPLYIPDACRKRTSVLLLGQTSDSRTLKEIHQVTDVIANKVVEVRSLDDLAGVWATLIPRRSLA